MTESILSKTFRTTACFLAVLCFSLPACLALASQTKQSIAAIEHKQRSVTAPSNPDCIRLIHGWQFLRNDLGGVWELFRPRKKGSAETVPLWEEVELPHCFNATDAVDPDRNYYQGPGWYKTALTLEKPNQHDRILLHFEGAGQKTQVYVHMTKVADHIGGYDEWTVDITDAVEQFRKSNASGQFDGKVPIAIRCDNTRDLEMIPSDLSDFNLYGGLYRYLNIQYVPSIYCEKAILSTSVDLKNNHGQIEFKALHRNNLGRPQDAQIEIVLSSPNGKTVAHSKYQLNTYESMVDYENLEIEDVELWSPDKPNLYQCKVTTKSSEGIHEVVHSVGFRQCEWLKNGPFLLNGERLLLKGTHRHEDHAGLGAAMSEDLLQQEMQMMKEMGVNFIRLGHYQQSRIVLDLCDQLGILVWEEIPWCRGGLGGEKYCQQTRNMLSNMITQHGNHPSVIIWGLGNENDWPNDFATFDKKEIREFMSELNDLAHQLDPSRKTAIRRCDFCKDIVDIYSPSIWAGWYRGKFTDYKIATEKEMLKVDHFFHAEWGASNHARRHSEEPEQMLDKIESSRRADERGGDATMYGGVTRVSKDGDWTETYACDLIDWHLKEQETMPWLTGSAYWPFKDFSTPVRPENPIPYVNQKGVVERDLEKKEAYYVFQSYWTEKPMVHIYGHTRPIRWGRTGQKKTVKVYSNCGKAELFLNGKSVGIKQRDSQNFPSAGLRWEVVFKEGKNKLTVTASKGGESVHDQIEFVYQTEKWTDPVTLELSLARRLEEQLEILVVAKDANGVRCLGAKNIVEFDITGNGKLIDNLGTSRGSRKLEMYNGRALIRVKCDGKSVVTASSEGLSTAFLTLENEANKPVLADN